MSIIVKEPEKKAKPSIYAHTWVKKDDNDFELHVEGTIMLRIWRTSAETWSMLGRIGEKTYKGTRPSLEEAAKAADRLLYKKFPHVWTTTDARAIIAPWRGDLHFDQDEKS